MVDFYALIYSDYFPIPHSPPARLATAGGIEFYTHPLPPFAYEENGIIDGFAVELVKEMMKKVGPPCELKIAPFIRGLKLVQQTQNYALFIVARRPEREKTVKWVGPLITSGVYFYKHKGNPIELNTLDDLWNVEIIAVGRGNADHTFLQSLGLMNLYPTNDQQLSLKMLTKDRIIVTPISEICVPTIAKKTGISIDDIEKPPLKLYDSTIFLVFSLDIPDATVAKWQAALEQTKTSGLYDKIHSKYFPIDDASQ